MASSAIYRYFESRDQLLTVLIIDAYSRLGAAIEDADAACDRVESAIRECLQRTSLKEFVAQAGPTGVAPSPAAADAHGGDPRVTELRRDATR